MNTTICNSTFGFVATVVALSLLSVTIPAEADVIFVDLTLANTSGSVPLSAFSGPFAQIKIDLTNSTTANITFTSDTATSGNPACTVASPCTYLMGDGGSAALNVNGAFVVQSGSLAEQNTLGGFTPIFDSIGSGNENGFGSFNLKITNFDGFHDSATSISFTLEATGGNSWASASDVLTANNHGAEAAAHIFVESNACTNVDGALAACTTGFATNGGTLDQTAPEPATLALLGIGLGGLGFSRRQRKP